MSGSLPEGWAVATLGDLCVQISDGTHQTPRYVSNGVPFYSVESVTNDDFENVKYITPEEARTIGPRAQPRRGDILMTRIGTLAKTKYIAQPANVGGKNILDNSCIYKDSFSLSPSKMELETCDVAKATADFTAKYGRPDATAPAPGGKTLLEYFLLFNDNSYHVKVFVGCSGGKTETFAMVECKVEKNRAKPGPPPKEGKPFWKQLSPF